VPLTRGALPHLSWVPKQSAADLIQRLAAELRETNGGYMSQ